MDPSVQMKSFLKDEVQSIVVSLKNSSEATVKGSKVDLGIAITAKRFAQTEDCITGTSALLAKMDASIRQLDDEVNGLIESVTLLEDVAAKLDEVNKECELLYETCTGN